MNPHRSTIPDFSCGTHDHWSRRTLLKSAGLSGLAWLTPLAEMLALDAESGNANTSHRPRSVILLWLDGGPSQIDTFDPHPGKKVSYGAKAIDTAVPGIQIARSLPQTGEMMNDIALIRSVVSKEGDHTRAIYNIKTGYRPDPTVTHPAIGSIICHELPDTDLEIPNHVSILPSRFPSRGGFLGAQFDAFQVGDPNQAIPDVSSSVEDERQQTRLQGLNILEKGFSNGRGGDKLDRDTTLHLSSIAKARRMMTSDQLTAFDVSGTPKAEREAYGDSAFGRGCHAALRLVEAGVRCVEVTLNGWDTHANNTELQASRATTLDSAFATLIRELKARELLDDTVVLCGGEFGRTPKMNPVQGRDHWPHGFSMAIAGGGIKGGQAIGSTDPFGEIKEPERPVRVEDVHATVQHMLGIDSEYEVMTPANRPIALSEGNVIGELLG
jgi:hypothetical protein